MNTISHFVVTAFIISGVAIAFLFNGRSVTAQEFVQNDAAAAKIQNAMSAAPEAVAHDATVLDWPEQVGTDFAVLRQGINNWTCLPDNPMSPGNDPMCVDQPALQFLQAYMNNAIPDNTEVGVGYMLQGGSSPSNTDPFATEPAEGEEWMSEPPHLMIFPSDQEQLDPNVYGTDHTSGGPWVMWTDTPYEHLMVPVE